MQFTIFLSYRVNDQISVEKMMQLAHACILRKGPGPSSESIPAVKHMDFVLLKCFGSYVAKFFKIVFLAR